MRSALEVCRRWEAEGKAVAAGTLVAVAGSAPRREGARLLVSSAGDTWGSVSNGCVEGDVAAHAAEVLRTGRPRLAAYGIADEQAFAVGLSCGGEIEVFIEPWAGLAALLGGEPGEEFVGALATVVAGPGEGAHGLFDRERGLVAGDLPAPLAEAVAAEVPPRWTPSGARWRAAASRGCSWRWWPRRRGCSSSAPGTPPRPWPRWRRPPASG